MMNHIHSEFSSLDSYMSGVCIPTKFWLALRIFPWVYFVQIVEGDYRAKFDLAKREYEKHTAYLWKESTKTTCIHIVI